MLHHRDAMGAIYICAYGWLATRSKERRKAR